MKTLNISVSRIYKDGFVTMDGTITHSFLGIKFFTEPAKVIVPKGATGMYVNGDPVDSVMHQMLWRKIRTLIEVQQMRCINEGKVPALTSVFG
ncbi:hypothetical protein MYO4S_00067 [Serratia phage 4S]|nr:hypothetical protein MYO4S_00067 [Serratia phage 4S]